MAQDLPIQENGDDGLAHSPFFGPNAQIDVTRRHLPHWQFDGGLYFITWRLADSLPQALLRRWREEKNAWLRLHPRPWDAETTIAYQRAFPRRMEDWLDAGYGSCVLRNRDCAECLAEALHHFDGERYDLVSFVIMPNHVHVLAQLRGVHRLERTVATWKGYSARRINEKLGRRGALWQQEVRDTCIRSLEHLARAAVYIRQNSLRARLSAGEYIYYEAPHVKEDLDFEASEP
jgi:REP element-mobilizing transposase RayT